PLFLTPTTMAPSAYRSESGSCRAGHERGVGVPPTYFCGMVLWSRQCPRWRLGLTALNDLLTPARGFRSSRHTRRKPLLFDPAQSACHQEGGGPLGQPLEWSASQAGRASIAGKVLTTATKLHAYFQSRLVGGA